MKPAKMLFVVSLSVFSCAAAYRLLAVEPAHAQSLAGQEVAVLAGTLPDGGTIPLPHYADGTEAAESECQWTVSINDLNSPLGGNLTIHCSAEGRIAHGWSCGRLDGDTGGCIGMTPASSTT